jgi:hypothetical protein
VQPPPTRTTLVIISQHLKSFQSKQELKCRERAGCRAGEEGQPWKSLGGPGPRAGRRGWRLGFGDGRHEGGFLGTCSLWGWHEKGALSFIALSLWSPVNMRLDELQLKIKKKKRKKPNKHPSAGVVELSQCGTWLEVGVGAAGTVGSRAQGRAPRGSALALPGYLLADGQKGVTITCLMGLL